MKHVTHLNDIRKKEMIPGFNARFIHADSTTISYWEIKKGGKLPKHQHHHEQITQVMEGIFVLTIEGITHEMTPGLIAVIPSNVLHSGVALTDCNVMDIFSPVREDYKL